MTVSPLPRRGGVQFDTRDEGRVLRVSSRAGEVVLSIWRDDQCVATHHVAVGEVPDLIKMLATTLAGSATAERSQAS